MGLWKLVVLAVIAFAISGIQAYPIDSGLEVELLENSNLLQLSRLYTRVERSQSSIKDADDLIVFLEGLKKDEITEVLVPLSVGMLRNPLVKTAVNAMFKDYPQVGEILEGVLSFLNGPEAEPLMAVIRPAFKSIMEAGKEFVVKIGEPLKEFSEIVTTEGVTAYIMVQTPMVLDVFDKFVALPEMQLIDPKVLMKMKDFIKILKKNSIAPK